MFSGWNPPDACKITRRNLPTQQKKTPGGPNCHHIQWRKRSRGSMLLFSHFTKGLFHPKDWDQKNNFLCFIKKDQLVPFKSSWYVDQLVLKCGILNLGWSHWDSQFGCDKSHPKLTIVLWMGVSALWLQDLSLLHGQELIQAQLRQIVEDGRRRDVEDSCKTNERVDMDTGLGPRCTMIVGRNLAYIGVGYPKMDGL